MEVDVRLAGRLAVTLGLVALAVSSALLFLAGVDKNAQIASLRQHGVAVGVTVSTCRGLLGGSGSNGAGYSCHGTFVLDERRYRVTIPGDTLLAPGTRVELVAAANDPGLVATIHRVDTAHASWRVFVFPTVLLAGLAASLAVLAIRRRRGQGDPVAVRSAGGPPGARLRRRRPVLG